MPDGPNMTPEQNQANQPTFEENVRGLITPPEEGKNPEINDEWLQKQARLVLHPFGRTREELSRILAEGNQKFSDGEVPEEEWEKLGGLIFEERERIGRRNNPTTTPPATPTGSGEIVNELRTLRTELAGGGKLDLPANPENQREMVRVILDGIENSNRDCVDYANVQIVRKLEVSLNDMEETVRDEVIVRLSLHDSSELVKQAGGYIKRDDGGLTIGGAATEAQRRQHDITNRVAEVCFREGLRGIQIPKAWDLLQDANFNYPKLVREANIYFLHQLGFDRSHIRAAISILEQKNFERTKLSPSEINNLDQLGLTSDLIRGIYSTKGTEDQDADPQLGKVPTNYSTDSDIHRKRAAQSVLIAKIGGDPNNARKALQLAEKMATATLETSVWNKSALAGNDQLAECIGIKDWRKRRREQGRPAGPAIHEDAIDGFGTSWNRLQRPGRDDPGGKVEDNIMKPQYARDVAIDKIKAASWQGYCVANVGRYYALKDLLLDIQPQPDKINLFFLQSSIPYFNTADEPNFELGEKTGNKALRVWWIAAILDLAATNPNLGWTLDSINALHTAAVLDDLSVRFEGSDGRMHGAGNFISQAQWDWAIKATDLYHTMGIVQGKRTFRETLAGIFGSIGGPNRKK